jgi:hypothetical protein
MFMFSQAEIKNALTPSETGEWKPPSFDKYLQEMLTLWQSKSHSEQS